MSLQTPTTIRARQWKLIPQGEDTSRAGVSSLDTSMKRPTIVGLVVKLIGKPSAGNRHARFDERGWETERWPLAPSYRAHPRLYLFHRWCTEQSTEKVEWISDVPFRVRSSTVSLWGMKRRAANVVTTPVFEPTRTLDAPPTASRL